MKVTNEITVRELNGSENKEAKPITVKSHWNRCEFVVLEMHGVEVTVSARELEAAIKNATNTARFL